MMSILAIGVGWAETTIVTASKVASSSFTWVGSAGENWSGTVDGGATNQNVINGYAQIGTKNSPSTSVTISTSGISGTITSIVIDCASYNGIGTVSATVGGNAFGAQSQEIPRWAQIEGTTTNAGGEVTFTGSASGAIVITMMNGTGGRAMYIKSVKVTYSGGTSTVAAPVISGVSPFEGSTQISISCETDGASIYYTTDGNDPSTTSTLYSAPFTINATTTVKALAAKEGMENSSIATATFKAVPTVNIPYEETFGSGFGDFYIKDIVNPGFDVWTTGSYDGTSYAKATGYKKPSNYDSESWLITPFINLVNASSPQFSFSQAVNNHFNISNGTLWVKENTSSDWTQIEITYPEIPTSNFSAFESQTIDLSAYKGKTIQIAFKYTSTTDASGTWEVTNFKVDEKPVEVSYYLVGTFNTYVDNNNETQWVHQDPNYKFNLNTADGSYYLNGISLPDNVSYKVLKVEGETETWYGGTNDGDYGVHSGHHTNMDMFTGNMHNYFMSVGGKCNFTISSDLKLTVDKTQLFLRGSFDNWSDAGVEMDVVETGGWTITKELAAGAGFGFRDGWNNWHGDQKTVTPEDYGTEITIGTENNYVMQDAGNYTLTVNSDMTKLVVTKVVVTHDIVIDEDIENGTISIEGNKTTAAVGETVTIIATPASGYELDKVTVINKDTDEPVDVNNLQFVMPNADVLVSAAFVEIEIPEGDYVKVTSDDQLGYGMYLIVYENGSLAFDGNLETLDAASNTKEVEIRGNMIKSDPDGIDKSAFIIDVAAGTIKSSKGYYIGQTSNNNGLASSETTAYENAISIDDDGNADVVSGGAYLRYNSTSGQERFRYFKSSTYTSQKAIQLYKKSNEIAPSLPTPEITGETPFLGSTTVTITCADEDAVLRYSTDGEDPTAESTLYEGPFTLTEAATVKAIAFKGEEFSSIASKDFEKKLSVSTIEEYIALGAGKTFVFTGNVTVTYVNGKNLYVKDDTGAALIYGNSNFEFEQGQVLAANWTATTTDYNGLLEAQNPSGLEATEATIDVTPVEMSVNAISTDNDNEYIIVKNVSISAVNNKNFIITDAENHTIAGRTNFSNVEHPSDLSVTYNITCVVAEYNGDVQLYPTEYKATSATLDGVVFTADRQWATWYGEEDLSLPNSDVKAYVVTGVEGDAVVVEEIDYIPSRVGVLLYSTKADSNLTAEIYTGDSDDIESDLKGVVAEETVNEPAYVLYNNQFVLLQEGTTVGAHRCYLPASVLEEPGQPGEPTGAPVLRIAMPGTVTAIDDLRYDSNGKAVGYYDLTGRYIGTSLNGKRGIFITSDGKKVVK